MAVAVAALGLIAWADPKAAAPVVTKDATADEAKREAVYLFKARATEARRVDAIAFRLETANKDLCADRRPRLALSWANAEAYGPRFRDAAIEAFQLGDGLTVTDVVRDGPAGRAGLQPGDGLVSVNGEAVPTGRDATAKLAKRVVELLGQSTAPVAFVATRGGVAQTISVTPVMACAYEVVIEESNEANAFADGRTIHINRGVIRLTENDDELALVIAHELAHNGQHHVQAEMHNARIVGLGGLLLDVAAAAGGVNTNGAFTKAGMQIGMAHAAPEFEAEADYVGMYYLARAGFRTDGVEDFWRKMATEYPDMIFVKTSHPTSPARFLAIAAASKEIEAKRAAGEPLVPNQKPDPAAKAQDGDKAAPAKPN